MTMPLTDVLDLARWAPSGDNTQPWRFAITGDDRVAVLGHDTRSHCVYDLDGRPSQISVGALLETLTLAATRFSLTTEIARREGSSDERPIFDVRFRHDASVAEDPLVAFIEQRRVQRRALRTRPLSAQDKAALERAAGSDFRVIWFEGLRSRARIAWLNFVSAKIRLTIPEAYEVHRDVIAWDAQTSDDRIPSASLGAAPPTLRLMRWAMASWKRIDFLNRFLGGTVMPRVELDLVPGLACAAHCVFVATRAPTALEDYVAAGRALQRFWLTATSQGLQFQPEYTPLIFSRYARDSLAFSQSDGAMSRARDVCARVERLLGADVARRAVFLGRIGDGTPAASRSLRLPLEKLLQPEASSVR